MYLEGEGKNFVQTYGSLILAIYAILQVWLIAFWKKFIWKGKIVIFESGGIEIGFAGFGPMITLTGTFRSQRKDVFVQDVTINLTRESDGANFRLGWAAFRSPQIKIGDPMATTVELPSGINVRIDQPIRYSIIFWDKKVQAQINRRLSPVFNEWKQFLLQRQEKIRRTLRNPDMTEDALLEKYFAEFRETSEIVQTALEFHASTSWLQSGMYRIKVEVNASSPDKIFSKKWKFFLDEEFSIGFRGNSLATLRELCLGKVEYYIANLEYIKDESR
jgi:hypothetical protein